MNFYHAYYKRQVFKNGKWFDTAYIAQGIVVLADDLNDATYKIMQCLEKVESGEYRAVLNSGISECLGLGLCSGFEGSFSIFPID